MVPARPDLSSGLPPDTALLKVILTRSGGHDCFQLQGHFRQQTWVTGTEELRHQHRPGMILADELEGPGGLDAAVGCYLFLRNWSDTKPGLTRWLTALRRQAGSRLRLIVWDDTDFGIPWELFWHSMDGASGWLGVIAQVIRWTTVHDADRHDQFSAEITNCAGRKVLCYEDGALTGGTYSIARPGDPRFHAVPTMDYLLRALERRTSAFGLVYVRCHGEHHGDIFKAKLAGVRLADLSIRILPALRDSKPVVFLNACNSARPVIDPKFGDDVNRNFAEVFLRQRASGVVATMAEVPIAQSAVLASRLLNDARSGVVQLPEFLRAHRARHAGRLPKQVTAQLDDADKIAICSFLYASSFAYFGHPDSTFTLAGSCAP